MHFPKPVQEFCPSVNMCRNLLNNKRLKEKINILHFPLKSLD